MDDRLSTSLPTLPIGWAWKHLGGLLSEKVSYGVVQPGEHTSNGVPIVRVTDVRDGRINALSPIRVALDRESRHARTRLHGGEVLLSVVGTIGESAIVPKALAGWNVARAIAVLRPTEPADAYYIHLCLRLPLVRHFIEMWANTTVQKTLNLQDVAKLPIPVATPDERLAIASVLGSLDDKIELNRRMNRTLEQMAAAIFKAWFVDFEPVRAKASGAASFPGMPQPVFDALPATFADSELGPIPEGWEVAGLGSLLVNIIDRVTPSQITEAMPYVPIDCIDAKSLTLSTSKPGTEAKSSLIRFRKDDILFGAMRPYFHKVCISPFDGTTRTTVFSLRPTATADLCFCALLLFQNSTIEFATQHSVGSTIPYAKWEESLAKMTCTIPPAAIRLGFDQIIRPMLLLARHNALESETLAETRDVLLPKLLSGEVRLPPTRGGGVIDDGSKSSTAQILAMARVADELESAPTPKWPELQCSGSHQAVMPVLDNGPAIERFEQQAYEHGFVIDFDWTGWQEQAGQYFSDPAHLAKADVHTVQRLVTTCIRKERFCEGTLASLHANGVLGAICRRLGQIAKESSK